MDLRVRREVSHPGLLLGLVGGEKFTSIRESLVPKAETIQVVAGNLDVVTLGEVHLASVPVGLAVECPPLVLLLPSKVVDVVQAVD